MNCWGGNENGQLGNASRVESSRPVAVAGLPANVRSLSAGAFHSCGIDGDGAVWCWGQNTFGQLGDGSSVDRDLPVEVREMPGKATAIAAGVTHTCAVIEDGQVACWGTDAEPVANYRGTFSSKFPVTVLRDSRKILTIEAGASHTCVSVVGTGPACWGLNNLGQLGSESDVRSSSDLVDVGEIPGEVASLSVGWHHTCTVLLEMTFCWGWNNFGELGDYKTAPRPKPVDVATVYRVKSVAAGGTHTCVLTAGNEVQCWGANEYGQLGLSQETKVYPETIPATIPNLTDVVSLAAGFHHTCALTTAGVVSCWGSNLAGQLGAGLAPSMKPQHAPARVR